MTNKVILSTPMLLTTGLFRMEEITLEEAKAWVAEHNPVNYVGHQTVKVLGLEPATSRDVCTGYNQALSLKVNGRIEFGKEYTVDEILAVGVTCFLITDQDNTWASIGV